MKVCQTYGGMSNLCRHVRLMKVCQNIWPFFGWFLPTVLAYRNLYISIWKASFLSSAAVFYWFCPWFTKVWIRCFYSKKEDAFLNSKGESKVCQLFFAPLLIYKCQRVRNFDWKSEWFTLNYNKVTAIENDHNVSC